MISVVNGARAYSSEVLATRYTPAVTIVAACMRADTGVGPAIASGSHTKSGICADLPVAPRKNNNDIAISSELFNSKPPN